MALTDADILSKHVDGVLLVVEAGRTQLETTRIARERLARVRGKVLDVVLNGESHNRARKTILRS